MKNPLILVLLLVVLILYIAGLWKCYEKAGEHGWAAIVPFYSNYVLFKIAMGQGWLFLVCMVPIIGWIFALICNYKFAKAYGKSTGFAIGNILLPIVFTPIIGFSKNETSIDDVEASYSDDNTNSTATNDVAEKTEGEADVDVETEDIENEEDAFDDLANGSDPVKTVDKTVHKKAEEEAKAQFLLRLEKSNEQQKKEKESKKKEKWIDKFNWALLRSDIEAYGYKYSFKSIMTQMLLMFAAIIGIYCVLKLQWIYIFMVLLIAFMATPLIVRAQFEQMYQIRRFQMVTSYLDNVIPIFKNKPVLRSAWQDTVDLVDGEMQDAVNEALDYLYTNTDDENADETACKIIEDHFPNSRIHAVHKMMMTIIRQNSTNYQASVDNLFYDVSAWIQRTFQFQKDLEAKKTQLLLICLITMLANCIFIFVYATNEIFQDFPQMVGYQVSTFLFVSALLILMCAFYIKMNGKWLVDDMTNVMEAKYNRSFKYIVMDKRSAKPDKPQIALSIVFFAIAAYCYMTGQNVVVTLMLGGVGIYALVSNGQVYQSHKKNLAKALEIEFPIWLRDVALNLNNLTVLNAISNSKVVATPIMEYYVNIFLEEAIEDPSSIKPYNDFLSEFGLPDVKSSMKILYTMQNLDQDQLQEQTNSLIIRNQEMLAKAERMKNEDSVSGIVKFGFAPVGLFMLQMMVSMGLIFMFMMQYMGSVLNSVTM